MLISLLTDFGLKDPYVGVMKGVIYSINSDVKIVDLSHHISSQNIEEASFVLHKSYRYFPKGTIFCCVVDPGVGSLRKAIIVKSKDYFFVSPDNGLLTPIYQDEEIDKIINIENPNFMLSHISNTFHGRDIFAPVSAYISKGIPIEKFGRLLSLSNVVKMKDVKPKVFQDKIEGKIIYVDHFGNLVTNIGIDAIKNRKIEKIVVGEYIIKGLSTSYQDVPTGELLAIFGSYDMLEVSVNQGSALNTIGRDKTVTVFFAK